MKARTVYSETAILERKLERFLNEHRLGELFSDWWKRKKILGPMPKTAWAIGVSTYQEQELIARDSGQPLPAFPKWAIGYMHHAAKREAEETRFWERRWSRPIPENLHVVHCKKANG